MEPSLDKLLSASAPPVTPRTPELERELARLAVEAETAVVPIRSRLRGRIALSALAALSVVGFGTAASAAGIVPAPPWAPWYDDPATTHNQTTSSGAECEVRYGAKAIRDQSHPVGESDRAAALAAAKDFLRDFDFATIDVGEAVERVPSTAVDPGAAADEVETFAVQLALQERLDAELTRQGLPATVGVSAATSCDGGNR